MQLQWFHIRGVCIAPGCVYRSSIAKRGMGIPGDHVKKVETYQGFTTQVVTLWCFNTVFERPNIAMDGGVAARSLLLLFTHNSQHSGPPTPKHEGLYRYIALDGGVASSRAAAQHNALTLWTSLV